MAEIKKISTELQLLDKFLDTSGDAGTSGQVLTSTGTGINWVSGGSLPGGPYLPLSAGSSYPLTGALYLEASNTDVVMSGNTSGNFTIDNTTGQIAFKAGSTVQSMIITSSQISLNEAVSVNSTSLSAPNKLQVNGQARVIGQFIVGNSSAGNTAARPIHVKQSGAATIRLEDSDNDNLAFDLIVDEGVGFKIAETIGGDAGDDTRVTIHETSGNVSIGTTTEEGRLLVQDSGLGNDEDDFVTNLVLMGTRWDLLFKQIRTADETDWKNTTVRIQGRVDSTNMQSIDFATDNSYNRHIDLNTGSNNFNTRFTAGGNVGIGTVSPNYRLGLSNAAALTSVYQQFTNGTTGNQSSDGTVMGIDADGDFIINNQEAKEIKLYTSDSQKVVINTGGNVGIGTTSPGRKLHIKDGQIKFQNTGSGGWAGLDFSTGNGTYDGYMGMLDSNGSFFIDVDSNGNDLVILQNGNVGIGTTSPNHTLMLEKDVNGEWEALRLFNYHSDGSTVGSVAINMDVRASNGQIARASIKSRESTADSPYSELGFFTSNTTSTAPSERMTIDKDGNVGIGTTSPSNKLEVNGVTSFTGGTVGGVIDNHTAGAYLNTTGRGLSGNFQGYARNLISSITGGIIEIGQGTSLISQIRLNAGSSSVNGTVVFMTKGSERMRLDSTGNVGIGLTNPAVPLDVEGKIRSNDNSSGDYLEIFCDGSVSGDSYIENTNNNIQIKSAFATSLSTSGSVAMFINDSQNVGIGTSSPTNDGATATTLEVRGKSGTGGGVVRVSNAGNTASARFFAGSASATIATVTNHDLNISTNNSLKMVVKAGGNVGIGTTSPGAKLDVAGVIFAGDGNKATPGYSFASDPDTGMFRDSANVLTFGVGADRRMSISNTVITTALPLGVNTTGVTSGIKLQVQGNVLFGSSGVGDLYLGNYATANHFRFHTNNSNTYFDMNCGDIYWRQGTSTRYQFFPSTANMTVQGTITQNSDARTKENVVEISDCISKVKAMRGVYYNRTDFNTEVTKVGVIAQEVEAVLPELVLESPETGLKSVAYSELTSVLINAIKEQQEIIEDLKTRITQLEN